MEEEKKIQDTKQDTVEKPNPNLNKVLSLIEKDQALAK